MFSFSPSRLLIPLYDLMMFTVDRDEEQLDYEYDSEAEWVDPEDGEECRSDDEDAEAEPEE